MDILNDHLSQLKLSPKSGPAVPPKPTKKNHPAQIPHSNNVRQTCEPLYSKNLQNNVIPTVSSSTSSPSPSLMHGKLIKQQQQQNLPHTIINNNKQSHYSNMEMTLDNPAILNHQLEALEHHKKQLEMKGMLPTSSSSTSPASTKFGSNIKSQLEKFQGPTPPPLPQSLPASIVTPIKGTVSGGSGTGMLPVQQSMTNNEQNKMITKNICESPKMHVYSNTSPALKSKIPSLSLQSSSSSSPLSMATQSSSASSASSSSSTSAAAINAGLNLKRNSDIVYSNILHQQNSLNSSSTPQQLSYPQTATHPNQVYTNISYNSGIGELPPPPPLELTGNLNLNTSHPSSYTLDYAHQINEDDLPPPPSPVSSSYSELRRATDNFPQMPVYPLPSVYDNGGGSSISSAIDPLSGTTDQQTYVNTSFQHDYSTYGPISQSSSPNSDCYGYGSLSKDSSTYESIYEPINPRPPSQLSSRSNYSLYTSYVNGIQSASPGTPLSGSTSAVTGTKVGLNNVNGRLSTNKEAEVETLTDLLVHSMDAGCDVDSFGVCVKCGERVVGENSGCTAMEQIYHIACFTCAVCQINLQGKPFYALDGKPHCEEDYLNTLEKCSVCMKPILERILRATGKPYHPGCFTCIVCGNSLDGIPFTVDATNQNYCIEDFHKKFAPRCCVCKQPIMPEPGQEETVRVVALDRSFHFECYKCEDCGLLLSSEAEGRGCYPLDDHVLCKSCNAKRVQALTNCMTTEL